MSARTSVKVLGTRYYLGHARPLRLRERRAGRHGLGVLGLRDGVRGRDRVGALVSLTTEQATQALVTAALAGALPAGIEAPGARQALRQAYDLGRAWEWPRSGEALARAYRALGAEPPHESAMAASLAWHRGEHPIQQAMVRT